MLVSTNYTVSDTLLQQAISEIPEFETSVDLNYRTGNFFYDPWLISDKFENTVWEEVLKSLPEEIGQARLIKLKPEECYRSHADIDDRYHLSISGNRSCLVDLDSNIMYPTNVDGKWYLMDAGKRHSAVNFGGQPRVQLVVRKLLVRGKIQNPQPMKISLETSITNFRYIFDDTFSVLLNRINKQEKLTDFKILSDSDVSFVVDKDLVTALYDICPTQFKITLI